MDNRRTTTAQLKEIWLDVCDKIRKLIGYMIMDLVFHILPKDPYTCAMIISCGIILEKEIYDETKQRATNSEGY